MMSYISEIRAGIKDMDVKNMHLQSFGKDGFGLKLPPDVAAYFKEYLLENVFDDFPF